MANDHVERPCAAHEDWSDMSLEEKVEVLAKWAILVTEYLEGVHVFKQTTKKAAGEIEDALKDITLKMNGGGPPPKHPLDPGC